MSGPGPAFLPPPDPAEPNPPDDPQPARPPHWQRRTPRRFGKGYARTEEDKACRWRRLEAIGRRCDGRGRTCVNNAATREIDVIPLDERGEPAGDMVTVLSCSRHKGEWLKNPRFKVVEERILPPQPPREPRKR